MLKPYHTQHLIEAGCDEAGRGCLAGPVVAAAVVWDKNKNHELIIDSKKLSKDKRMNVEMIIKDWAIEYAIGVVDQKEIDQINILQASIKAMHLAIASLKTKVEHLIIDGNKFYSYKNVKHTCIIKGDNTYTSIAAASILAKNYRDNLMQEAHSQFPEYAWNKNVGYATLAHRKAIISKGVTPLHRQTFCKKILSQNLFSLV